MPDLLAADLSPFCPAHSASAPTGAHTHTRTHTHTHTHTQVHSYANTIQNGTRFMKTTNPTATNTDTGAKTVLVVQLILEPGSNPPTTTSGAEVSLQALLEGDGTQG